MLLCYKLQATNFWEIYNATVVLDHGPLLKRYLSDKFDPPETLGDRAKMNFTRRLCGNYFEPLMQLNVLRN